MHRQKPVRYGALSLIVIAAALTTGCHPAMSTQSQAIQPPPETLAVPLRFAKHNFEAYCYNTLNCKVVYDNFNFTPHFVDTPSPAPSSPNYRVAWNYASYLGIDNFPAPADVQWSSLDGVRHEAKVDMAEIFKDQLSWHKVPKVLQ